MDTTSSTCTRRSSDFSLEEESLALFSPFLFLPLFFVEVYLTHNIEFKEAYSSLKEGWPMDEILEDSNITRNDECN
jgi:hypothetical protein